MSVCFIFKQSSSEEKNTMNTSTSKSRSPIKATNTLSPNFRFCGVKPGFYSESLSTFIVFWGYRGLSGYTATLSVTYILTPFLTPVSGYSPLQRGTGNRRPGDLRYGKDGEGERGQNEGDEMSNYNFLLKVL